VICDDEVSWNDAFSKASAMLQQQAQSEMQKMVAREAFRQDAGRFVLY
jgi:hypothetical protein